MSIEGGRVLAVGPAQADRHADVDFGDAVILPGFVNAHTHLELTGLRGKVPPRGSFIDWIVSLAGQHPRLGDPLARRESVRAGIRESLAAGVTAVADIGADEMALEEWTGAPLNVVGFLEVLGMGPKRLAVHETALRLADEYLERTKAQTTQSASAQIGLSPHAPYSTDTSVYRAVIEWAGRTGGRVTTHLAETREEHQFLADGTGPFRDLLERFGLWDGSFEPPGCSPVEYAARLGLLRPKKGPAPLAHVNYVSDTDLDLLARSGASVAYCPRSHAFFGHEPHRYQEMLAHGINVCIGTDSLASNQTLSVLDEIRHLARTDPQAGHETLLQMATLNGASALGLADRIGSLAPGKRADFVVVPLSETGTRDPLADILRGDAQPLAVYVGGNPPPFFSG